MSSPSTAVPTSHHRPIHDGSNDDLENHPVSPRGERHDAPAPSFVSAEQLLFVVFGDAGSVGGDGGFGEIGVEDFYI